MKNTKAEVRLTPEDIKDCNPDIFGAWTSKLDQLKKEFDTNERPYVIIPNFLNDETAEKLYGDFPTVDGDWWHYSNPIEVKYAHDRLQLMTPDMRNFFYALSHQKLVDMFSHICGVANLEYDPYLHGAGMHAHPRNGRLNLHLDYETHPITGKVSPYARMIHRKLPALNIILYMTKDWKPEWNGHTELWAPDMSKEIARSPVVFNHAIVFETSDLSWHGLPEKITCPEGTWRQSLAYYYVSPFSADKKTVPRVKATFVARPTDKKWKDKRMEKLYAIRPNRRIEAEDMEKLWPEWTPDLNY